MPAFAEINERGNKIAVHFPYDFATKEAVKAIGGARFVGPDKPGGPYWTVPLDLNSARKLREVFGSSLQLGDALKAWGRESVKKERNLAAIVSADRAELTRLPDVLPKLYEYVLGRPFQTADIAFMALTDCINANEPSLGKTVETIAAVFEAGLDEGPQLVSAPVTVLNDAWRTELSRFQPYPILVAAGSAAEKRKVIAEASRLYEHGEPFWLVTNPDTVRYDGVYETDPWTGRKEEVGVTAKFPELFEINWKTVTCDEFHKMGLGNPKTLGARAFHDLKRERCWANSGTPMGGKPIKLWGALHWLDPKEFSSKWNWAGEWLVIEDNGFGKTIGDIKEGREDEFYAMLAPRMVRRLKKEVMADLPPHMFMDVWCQMGKKQRKQYDRFAADAEIRIDELSLSAVGVLAEYTRLKQLANAYCEIEIVGYDEKTEAPKFRVKPTSNSAKLETLLEKLDERGLDGDENAGDFKIIIASQSKEMADMVVDQLKKAGIPAVKITGDVKQADRDAAIFAFNNDEKIRAIVMTTTAGGLGIDLERANAVAVLDETWNPDDQDQVIERGDRGSRTTPLEVWRFRTRDSIDEYINSVTDDKAFTNKNILDTRRNGFRAAHKEAA